MEYDDPPKRARALSSMRLGRPTITIDTSAVSTEQVTVKASEDMNALISDPANTVDFVIEHNPFAFTSWQLGKILDHPKSLSAFWNLGGLDGLESGLRTTRASGLETHEGRNT
ncbi:hypothetical protein B0T22DRAFT_476190 [Podospora appendiculata]|uniref:Uncharacterized protein n=1 Tax=Podospora appendiculata TaxID=314037 RepID=A0AAE1CG63_9PEZI|nr:hypothetical protein B0T22DRAFT_476190 [Podospora appendiculata]